MSTDSPQQSIEQAIQRYLGLDEGELRFDYEEIEGRTRLSLVTINPRHRQQFLFHTTEGLSKDEAGEKMLDYIRNTRDAENSYTIQWAMKGTTDLHTSYFRAPDIYSALDKLHYGRDASSLTVYVVQLNPIS